MSRECNSDTYKPFSEYRTSNKHRFIGFYSAWSSINIDKIRLIPLLRFACMHAGSLQIRSDKSIPGWHHPHRHCVCHFTNFGLIKHTCTIWHDVHNVQIWISVVHAMERPHHLLHIPPAPHSTHTHTLYVMPLTSSRQWHTLQFTYYAPLM